MIETTKPPLNPNAQKWVDALRSGKYKQGRQQLCNTLDEYNDDNYLKPARTYKTYCCLGVLCEVAVQEGVITSYVETDPYLPQEVQKWAGLVSEKGQYINHYNEKDNLADDNNDKYNDSFEQIASIIESQPTGLFMSQTENEPKE